MQMVGFPMPSGDLMVQNCVPEGDSLEGLKTLLRFKGGGGGHFLQKAEIFENFGVSLSPPWSVLGAIGCRKG